MGLGGAGALHIVAMLLLSSRNFRISATSLSRCAHAAVKSELVHTCDAFFGSIRAIHRVGI